MTDEILSMAQNEYAELEHYVKNYKGSFEQLCQELGGFNYDRDQPCFDVDYKSYINTTVYSDEDIGFYLSDVITVWDDGDGTTFPIAEDFYVCQTCGKLIPYDDLVAPNPTLGCLCNDCLKKEGV